MSNNQLLMKDLLIGVNGCYLAVFYSYVTPRFLYVWDSEKINIIFFTVAGNLTWTVVILAYFHAWCLQYAPCAVHSIVKRGIKFSFSACIYSGFPSHTFLHSTDIQGFVGSTDLLRRYPSTLKWISLSVLHMTVILKTCSWYKRTQLRMPHNGNDIVF